MHDPLNRISHLPATSEKNVSAYIVIGVLALAVVGLAGPGCAPKSPANHIEPPPGVRVEDQKRDDPYRLVNKELTAESLRSWLDDRNGRPVVVCLWSAKSKQALGVLTEALQWQAFRMNVAVLGIYLGSPAEYDEFAIPILRKVGPLLPCATVAPGHELSVLAMCGLAARPTEPCIVLLNEEGRPTTPAGQVLNIPKIRAPVASRPAEATQGDEPDRSDMMVVAETRRSGKSGPAATVDGGSPPAASQQVAASQGAEHRALLVMYTLELVHLADGARVSQHHGTVVWRQAGVAGTPEEQGSLALQRLSVGRIGQEVVGKAGRNSVVAIGAPKCMGAVDGQAFGGEFGEMLAGAVRSSGGKALGPAQVRASLDKLGLPSEDGRAAAVGLRQAAGAEYLVTGSLTVTKMR